MSLSDYEEVIAEAERRRNAPPLPTITLRKGPALGGEWPEWQNGVLGEERLIIVRRKNHTQWKIVDCLSSVDRSQVEWWADLDAVAKQLEATK